MLLRAYAKRCAYILKRVVLQRALNAISALVAV